MRAYPELDRAWQDMLKADSLYQVTEFWRDASEVIMQQVKAVGVENFRSLRMPLDYFVPTHGEGKQKKKDVEVGVVEPIFGDTYLDMLPGYALVERGTIPFGYRIVDNFHSELRLFNRQ